MKTTKVLAAAATIVLAGTLVSCSEQQGGTASGGNDATNCTNTIPKTDLPVVTMWAWYPNMELVVDNFNEQSDDVQVCWTNVGQGGDEYDKFQTAITAGTGAPDVIMIEADRIPTFQIQEAIVDISDYGYEDVKDDYSEGAWKDVSVGDGVYGAPVDGGPMGMIYRADVFEQYGITPPTTWAEYETAAQTVKDAGGPLFGDLGANVPAVMMALQYQNGAQPFTYDSATPESIGIALDDNASKEVLDYWAGLVEKGLVGTQDQFTPEYISGVIGGDYATYISAAWAPGYLTGAGVGEGDDAGVWKVAPLPQWDAANPVSVNWGGSAFSVTSQASDPELAAKVAFGVYADDASLLDGWQNQVIFPLNLTALNSTDFVDYEVPFFGGQQANKEVYVPAANAYTGMTYTPFGQYYFDAFTEQLAAINEGSVTGSEAAERLQADVVAYAEEQGFTVE
ncbi:extracellular solute-binding protein [Microbacterium wangruii]|uniref:ABC transporter substrate-binding protein n=2 Tax=Microbacterium wangruii TaxID=3049073 RepID=UPI00254BB490|nr:MULTISPECIES: extracellular solute-binding protein [unclassified Microbacterium]MDL5485489.1 extracellular solute-binding protein [Microbacterium sp. zg-Y1211]WIM28661.1 extracellular solute-binding protein [Microbacterium sp. zg-Y1090]